MIKRKAKKPVIPYVKIKPIRIPKRFMFNFGVLAGEKPRRRKKKG